MVFFRKTFDVENKPLSSMGYVVGAILACGWWGICLAREDGVTCPSASVADCRFNVRTDAQSRIEDEV